MSFADALNSVNAQAGTEDGSLYLTNGDGDEFTKVGDFHVLQTNSGPDLRLGDGKLSLYGQSPEGRTVTATYDPATGWE